MTYCTTSDLLIGDITADTSAATLAISNATDEIDAALGFEYVTPINTANVATHIRLTLTRCCALIASGRYLLAQGTTTSDEGNSYGWSLLKEGQGILKSITSGQVSLIGVERRLSSDDNTGPSITQFDATSPLDAFYGATGTKSGQLWAPGS